MTTMRPDAAPPAFHVLAKPSGPICNLDCTYCFFLEKEAQERYVVNGLTNTTGVTSDKIPPQFQRFADAPLLGTTDAAGQIRIRELTAQLLK